MHFIFKYLSSLLANSLHAGLRLRFCLGLMLLTCLVNNTANGQASFQPHDFGDTPSPTEMMARLKYHKQQETPLFDLLRESGVDIFSKLSDDEKKLAGRFVEDMILKEGMDSEKVSSLMKQMNIGSEARQALQEGIERTGVDESAISLEQRKELADKIRKDFLQRSASQSDNVNPSVDPNLGQPNSPSDLATSQNREAANNLREQLELDRRKPAYENPSPPKRADDRLKQQDWKRQLEELSRQSAGAKKQANPTQSSQPSQSSQRNGGTAQSNPNQKTRNQLDPSERSNPDLAGPETATKPNGPFDRSEPGRRQTDRSTQGDKRAENSSPGSSQSQPAQQVLNQLESQLNDSQQKIVSEFRQKIQGADFSREDIGDLLRDLQAPQPAHQFANQLDKAGEKYGLSIESRDVIQETLSDLSQTDRNSLQQAFNGIDENLLSQLANNAKGRDGSGFGSPSYENSNSAGNPIDNLRIEQLGKDFLKDALATYNNADSGYELSPAFKQLKDRAEGKQTDRQMANLGNLSKQLFDGSAELFDPNSDLPSRPDGVKPGQRLDQLLASAAGKALAGSKASDDQNESALSGVLNNALGVVLDKAVTIADEKEARRNRDWQDNWNNHSQPPPSNLSIQDQLSSFQDLNDPANDSAPNSSSDNSSNSSSSTSESSIDDAAATIADSVSQMEFDGRTLMYVAGGVILLSIAAYLLFRLIPTADENVLKQRELQRKLQNNSANPKDVVEAVDLFLLSRFGDSASWWNSKHATDQVSTGQPDWRDKVASLFQVYRWSRYQAGGDASVSPEQNELVKSTLKELSQANEGSAATAPTLSSEHASDAYDEATS